MLTKISIALAFAGLVLLAVDLLLYRLYCCVSKLCLDMHDWDGDC